MASVTAPELVLGSLRTDVLTGRLRPGAQIVQESLAERYGVSRVPLREALKVLEGEGLVVHHAHRGYFVAELSLADLVEVYRLRALLEAEAITAAMANLDEGMLADLVLRAEQLHGATTSDDVSRTTDANRRFHFGLFEASGLPRLVRLLRQLWDATDAYRALYFTDRVNLQRVDREHTAILDAIRAGDAQRVIALHDEHRAHAVEALREALGAAAKAPAPPD